MLPGHNWILPARLIREKARLPEWVMELTPIDAMLYAMRRAFASKEYFVAADIAARAAPYMHPKLVAAAVKVEGTLTLEQLILESMQPPGGDPTVPPVIEHADAPMMPGLPADLPEADLDPKFAAKRRKALRAMGAEAIARVAHEVDGEGERG
jgi:hypothetical protein